jgi:hypothetical protein
MAKKPFTLISKAIHYFKISNGKQQDQGSLQFKIIFKDKLLGYICSVSSIASDGSSSLPPSSSSSSGQLSVLLARLVDLVGVGTFFFFPLTALDGAEKIQKIRSIQFPHKTLINRYIMMRTVLPTWYLSCTHATRIERTNIFKRLNLLFCVAESKIFDN